MSDFELIKVHSTGKVKMTEITLEKFNWVIEDFSKQDQFIYSSNFDGLRSGSKWCLLLCPNGNNEEKKGYLSLYLVPQGISPPQVVSFKLHILNSQEEKTKTRVVEKNIFSTEDWGFREMLPRSTVLEPSSGFLVDDKLTIACEVKLHLSESINSDTTMFSKQESVFESKQFTDCVLVGSDDIEVSSWKFCLASQSPVFRAMFTGDTEEAHTGRVKASDVRAEVMQEVSRFVCCGKVHNLTVLAEELLSVADKYQIEDLKNICAHELRTTLSKENVCNRLIVADHHNVISVKEAAIKFINNTNCERNELAAFPHLLQEFSQIVPVMLQEIEVLGEEAK